MGYKIKTYKEFLKEGAYPGPNLITNPGQWTYLMYPSKSDVDPKGKRGQSFSYPYDDTNGPNITRWSGDGKGKLGIKGGNQGGKIGGEFDNDFSPGGEVKRNMSSSEDIPVPRPKRSERKRRLLKFLRDLK